METNITAIVFGVLPKDNILPGQVLACLDRAAELLASSDVDNIAVIGGYGHGSRGQLQPEAQMMKDHLLDLGVDPDFIIMRSTPVTTPEVVWEVRTLGVSRGCILTIREKKKRISLYLRKIVGNRVELSVETVPYILTPEEVDANKHEGYLLDEAERDFEPMSPSDDDEETLARLSKIYSFEYHLLTSFIEQLRNEGRLESFLAEL